MADARAARRAAHKKMRRDRPVERPVVRGVFWREVALLDGLAPQWDALAYSAGVAIVLFAVGFWYFERAKDDFESAL